MATWTKTFTETDYDTHYSPSTWTVVMTANNCTSDTNGVFTFAPTLTAKYSAANSRTHAQFEASFNVGIGSSLNPHFQYEKYPYASWTANTAVTIPLKSGSQFDGWELGFDSSTKTTKTITRAVRVDQIFGRTGISGQAYGNMNYGPSSPVSWGNVTFTLNTPPTCSGSFTSFSSGHANFSCSATGKYEADISSMSVAINSQTGSATSIGSNEATRTISVPITAHGKFTPTLTVTDSRTLTTTKSLAEINVYSPSVVFNCERANSDGTPSEGGESYAVITANFNWLDSVTMLAAPTVSVTDVDNTAVTTSVTWYTTRSSDGTLSNPISSWGSIASSSMPIYGLISGNFNAQRSYKVSLTPNDAIGAGTTNVQMLSGAFYTIDFFAGGHGIAFGMPSNQNGFYCGMDAYFKCHNGTMRQLLDFFHPVYSYYETSLRPKNTNETGELFIDYFDPGEAWGGTWILEIPGMVHVSGGSGYTVANANSASGAGQKDGGNKDAIIPYHNHGFTNPTINRTTNVAVSVSGGAHKHAVYVRKDLKITSGGGERIGNSSSTSNEVQPMNPNGGTHSHTVSITQPTFSATGGSVGYAGTEL